MNKLSFIFIEELNDIIIITNPLVFAKLNTINLVG